jgi:predicted Ser/Thr protein kinase
MENPSDKYRNLAVIKTYTGGRHADEVVLLKNNIVRKKYSKQGEIFFKREAKILKKLKKCNFVPKLLYTDKERRTIYMSYCGSPIPKLSPYEAQINNFIHTLKHKYGIYHNDIKKGNICMHDGQLYLIDFSWANTIPYKVEENRKGHPLPIEMSEG